MICSAGWAKSWSQRSLQRPKPRRPHHWLAFACGTYRQGRALCCFVSRRNWSRQEVQLVVADYFAMLHEEIEGRPYNKKARNEAVRRRLDQRTHPAVELKHQNISAILLERHLRPIDGYQPLANYQKLLADEVDAYLSELSLDAMERSATKTDDLEHAPQTLRQVPTPKPPPAPRGGSWHATPWRNGRVKGIDFLALEMANRALGDAGERLVFDEQRRKLATAGRDDLARRVQWVSKEVGDGLGYDIRSFRLDGSEKWIEVKTTRCGVHMPFLISRNEVECSVHRPECYELHRVFSFPRQPAAYVLAGSLRERCSLDPRTYLARVV